jgi:hypothetical protein
MFSRQIDDKCIVVHNISDFYIVGIENYTRHVFGSWTRLIHFRNLKVFYVCDMYVFYLFAQIITTFNIPRIT